MADNVTANSGSGGAVFATDDISSVHYPRQKLALGADGSATDAVGGAGAVSSAVQRVTLASDDPLITLEDARLGSLTETAPATDTASSGLNGRLQRIAQRLTSLIALIPTSLGQKVKASSFAVTIASDQDALPITDNSGSITVDNAGTFATQAAQSGTWTVQPGNTANTTAWKVDGSAVTQPVSAASLPLPSGAATEATLDARTGALTETPPATDTASSGLNGRLQRIAQRLTSLIALVPSSLGQKTKANSFAVTIASDQDTLAVSLASVPSHAVTNAGTFATQVDGAALTALQLIDDAVVQDDTAFTPATTKVMMAGFQADETATDSVDEGDAGAARMTLDRKAIVNPQPHTAGGLSTFMASGSDGSSILVATAQAAKASAGQVYGYYCYNPEAAVTFVHFYNVAQGSVTVGTTAPLFTIQVPAGSAANLMGAHGIAFDTAITVAATTTAGGNTAPSTGVSLTVWYK